MTRPSFCASCITGPVEVRMADGDREYWICRRCDSAGGDESLPQSLNETERELRDRRVQSFLRRNPEASIREMVEVAGLSEDLSPRSSNARLAYRMLKRCAS